MDRFHSRERAADVALEPRVTAIVAARSVGQALELCLRSVLAEPWIDELVIVNHGAPPAVGSALRALKADRRDVKLAEAPANAGLAAALNAGAAKAKGRWLLFLDPHVVLQRGAVERLAAAGGGAPGPYIVGGRLTDTQGRDRRAARAGALNAWSAVAVALNVPGRRVRRARRQAAGEPTRVAAVSGAFMLTPRAHFETLGGFDEGYATDAADLDLCRRAAEAGGAVLFEPTAAGVQFAPARRSRREAQGLARFAAKSARTPAERAFALVARPAFSVLLGLRDFVAGRPPAPR